MNATGNNYLTVYGYFRNPLTEYYITESFGNFDPAQYPQQLGTYDDAEGNTYKLAREIRTSHLPMEGSTMIRVFASRRSKRLSGSVDVGAHFEAWKAKGLKIGGPHMDQIMAIEGYQSSGEASVTVW
jgi:endo-1,4-beta-xylanase